MQADRAMDRRVQQHHAELVAFFTRRIDGDAEALAQEVWLRIARAEPVCPTSAEFRAYAFAVARRLLIDQHRRNNARIQLVPLDVDTPLQPADPTTPQHHLHAVELLKLVERTLSHMNPALAEVFRWRTSEQLSFKEIAARQGVPVNTALGRMHQATQKLAAALRAAGALPPEPHRDL